MSEDPVRCWNLNLFKLSSALFNPRLELSVLCLYSESGLLLLFDWIYIGQKLFFIVNHGFRFCEKIS